VAIPFVHIQARGAYREIGRQIGEAARAEVEASVAFFRDNFESMSGGLTFAEAEAQAAGYRRYAQRCLPQFVEELMGMAEGSRVPFSQLMVPNCGEEFTSSEPVVGEHHRGFARGGALGGDYCTAVAVSASGRHVIGHNMDWYTIDAANNMMYDVTVPDGTRFLGIAGAAYLPMIGLNSHGIGNVSNSVHSDDNRVGVPNVFVRRWSLEAPTLEEARARGLLEARARGTNHFLTDTTGRLWDVETSATAGAFMESDSFMAHTNHYVAPEMAPYEGATFEESRTRLATAERMLAEGTARGDDPVELVASVLRGHKPSPEECICGHPSAADPPAEQIMTVGSMICDLDERRVYVCAGPPCENPYQVFEM
jgi:isopenicillin-N N-acyltransferase-like protein